MKKLFNLLLIGVFLLPQLTYGALIDDLVSYWTLEETSGARIDQHGTNDLTDNNTVSYGTGINSNGADFEATNNESLSITDGSQTGLDFTGDFAQSYWVNFESLADHTFSVKGYNTGSQRQWTFRYINGTTDLEFQSSNSCSGGAGVTVDWSPSTSTWYNVVINIDSVASEIDFYVNGSQVGTTQTIQSPICNGTETFYMGIWFDSGTPYYAQDGIMDEVAFWSRKLTTDEITTLYNGGTGTFYADFSNEGGGATTTATTTQAIQTETYASILFVLSVSLTLYMLLYTFKMFRPKRR